MIDSAEPKTSPPLAAPRAKTKRVLIVEDDEDLARATKLESDPPK